MNIKNYYISSFNTNDGWILIHHDDYDEPDGMVALIKAYAHDRKIYQAVEDDTVYGIENDPYKLTFQWDDLFGTVVILNNINDKEDVYTLLNKLFEQIN